jgi:hypothetical protein
VGTPCGTIKIMDFGLAQRVSELDGRDKHRPMMNGAFFLLTASGLLLLLTAFAYLVMALK